MAGVQKPPRFDAAFRARFRDLVLWRRDVRRFRRDPVDDELIAFPDRARQSCAVGRAQPAVALRSRRDGGAPDGRARLVRARQRASARRLLRRGARRVYARLKLEGLDAAPVQLAVFADEATDAGAGLGRQTMPETLRYSVVGAVHTLWLAARAEGLGLGWISILEPDSRHEGARCARRLDARRLSLPRTAGGGASRSGARPPRVAGAPACREI